MDDTEGLKAFENFYEGLLSRKKEGFTSIKEEVSYLYGLMKEFSVVDSGDNLIRWNRVDLEIEMLEKEVNRESLINLYKEILIENPRKAIFRVFADKHKSLASKFEIDQKVASG